MGRWEETTWEKKKECGDVRLFCVDFWSPQIRNKRRSPYDMVDPNVLDTKKMLAKLKNKASKKSSAKLKYKDTAYLSGSPQPQTAVEVQESRKRKFPDVSDMNDHNQDGVQAPPQSLWTSNPTTNKPVEGHNRDGVQAPPTSLGTSKPTTNEPVRPDELDKLFDPGWSVSENQSGIASKTVATELVHKFILPIDRRAISAKDNYTLVYEAARYHYMSAACSSIITERFNQTVDELQKAKREVDNVKAREEAALFKTKLAEEEIKYLKKSRAWFEYTMKKNHDRDIEKLRAEYETKLAEARRDKEVGMADAVNAYKSSPSFSDDVLESAGNMFMSGWETHRNLTLKAHPGLDLDMVVLPDDLETVGTEHESDDCQNADDEA